MKKNLFLLCVLVGVINAPLFLEAAKGYELFDRNQDEIRHKKMEKRRHCRRFLFWKSDEAESTEAQECSYEKRKEENGSV